MFYALVAYLVERGYVKLEKYSVDGGKIEADANMHKVVWAKRKDRYQQRVKEQIRELLEQIEPANAEALANAALDILEEFPRLTDHCLQLRIGIHTGPVVAGVIGKNKFIYDLWGDTVNIAKPHAIAGSAEQHAGQRQDLRISQR